MINKKILLSIFVSSLIFISLLFSIQAIAAAQSAVNLGTAGNFVILSKTGISATGTTLIVGNIGASPIDSTSITGFDLIADSSNQFSTSSLVTGKIYAADYTPPTPIIMTTAVSDMETAYNDATGRTLPTATELGAGNIGGMTLAPGLYKWGTGVLIPTDVTLSGNANDIWIFQIAGTLDIASATQVKLIGGAQAKNIYWVVADTTTLGTTSVFNGNILDLKDIVLNTGAKLNGRALAQTAVTLDANSVSLPVGVVVPEIINPVSQTPTNSNQNSGGVQVNNNSLNNISNGLGLNLSQQVAEKRTEYNSGYFTTSLGQYLNVQEISSNVREFREGNVVVETNLTLTKVEGNKSKVEVELSNGRNAEIKIMPSTASDTAIARLKLKVCNETNNCTITLKEVGVGNEIRLVYQMKAQKNVKILGLFKAKMNIETNVDAETKQIISTKIPWWNSISVDAS